MKDKVSYICPTSKEVLKEGLNGLVCENGHLVPFIEGTKIPVFEEDGENSNEYTTEIAAEIHENALRWVFNTFGGSEEELRNSLMSRLNLKHGQKVLITGVGAGNDLPKLAELLGDEGVIVAQDYAKQMLLSAVDRVSSVYGLKDYNIEFSVSDASNLPYADNSFDAAYHFGGINLFPDIKSGVTEMNRVVKSGGKVVFCDEGMAPWMKDSEIGKMLINNNYLYDYEAPIQYVPITAKEVNLSWEVCNCFYVIDFVVSDDLPKINFEVPHLGKRGGSISKRYFGQLEGVDLKLKENLYNKAEELNISRVDLIEKILSNGLSDLNK